MKRKICVCTGTRSDYGLLKPLLFEIKKSKKLELQLVATGMHFLERFGNSSEEIKKDGFKIDAGLKIFFDYDSGDAMAKSIANGITAFTDCFKAIKPDIVVVLGDRAEVFAAATAAACLNIPIAHLHGGDFANGGLDEIFRYSISKFSNIHLAATKKSAERIRKMGEEPWRIHIVGAPGLDSILAKKFLNKKETCQKFGLDAKKPIVLVLQHSVSIEPNVAKKQVLETMGAVRALGLQSIVIYPNSDPGGRRIIKAIEKYKKFPFIKIFKNLDHNEFLGLMNCSSVMVGNSSSGIIESSSFRLPVVNIGQRQFGRERSENVIDVGYEKNQIKKAIKTAMEDKDFIAKVKNCRNPYGNGTAGKKIVRILESLKIDRKLLQKQIA